MPALTGSRFHNIADLPIEMHLSRQTMHQDLLPNFSKGVVVVPRTWGTNMLMRPENTRRRMLSADMMLASMFPTYLHPLAPMNMAFRQPHRQLMSPA